MHGGRTVGVSAWLTSLLRVLPDPGVFGSLDSWVRRRLRAVQGKRSQRRCAELLKRGVSFQYAATTAASARGPWRLARSQAVQWHSPIPTSTRWGSLVLPSLMLGSTRRMQDPHVLWCGRGARVTAPPIPISCLLCKLIACQIVQRAV
jgi:hypothetical protein